MTDQRFDPCGLNIMQRVFDCLSTDRGTSIHDLMMAIRISRGSVVKAIKRLQQHRLLERATCDERGIWLYRRRKDALRPMDRRGGGSKRQMMQEAA